MQRTAAVLVTSVVFALSACGGGDGEEVGGAVTTTSGVTTTSAVTTTSTAPERAPELAAITTEDLGEPWSEHTGAEGYRPPDEAHCRTTAGEGALEALVEVGSYFGPISQRGEAIAFARTATYEFVDEDAAKAFVDVFRSEPYQECRVEAMTTETAAAEGSAEGSSWRLREVGDAEGEGNDGFELQLSYQFQATVDGEVVDANGRTEELIFRRGSVVSVALAETVLGEEDPEDLEQLVLTEVTAAIVAALDRLP